MANHSEEENQLNAKLNMAKLPLNTTKFYSLTKKQDWVETLLLELNEKAESKEPSDFLNDSELMIDLQITKSYKPEYGEYLLIKGHINTQYHTSCVRTLEDMTDTLTVDFNSCFLESRFEDDEAFSDQLEIYEKDELYELYFYKKGVVDLAEMTHEIIYLNINQYPIKDENSPLVWGKEETDTKQ